MVEIFDIIQIVIGIALIIVPFVILAELKKLNKTLESTAAQITYRQNKLIELITKLTR